MPSRFDKVFQVPDQQRPTFYMQETYQMEHMLNVPGVHLLSSTHPKNPFTQNLR